MINSIGIKKTLCLKDKKLLMLNNITKEVDTRKTVKGAENCFNDKKVTKNYIPTSLIMPLISQCKQTPLHI